MTNFKYIIENIKIKNNIIAVAGSNDPITLEAIKLAEELKIANFILIEESTQKDSCEKAVSLVKKGQAKSIMKGLVETSTLLKAILNKETGISTKNRLSLVSGFEIANYHKMLFVTDPAINISHDTHAKKQLIENAVNMVKKLGIEKPKVAMLAAKEKADSKMPVTEQYLELLELQKNGDIKGCFLAGPLALDNAINLDSAKIKGIDNPVAGDADILLCPDIESANILYKSLVFLAQANSGSIVCGAEHPIILTSRADNVMTKLNSIVLSLL